MGKRLTKIYTRTGDDGTTGLGDGTRLAKESVRIEAIGTVDELNSCIGVLLAENLEEDVRINLENIQHDLFRSGRRSEYSRTRQYERSASQPPGKRT